MKRHGIKKKGAAKHAGGYLLATFILLALPRYGSQIKKTKRRLTGALT